MLSIILAIGIALDDEALRENTRWVMYSEWMNRGYINCIVVSRLPSSVIESAMIFAVIVI